MGRKVKNNTEVRQSPITGIISSFLGNKSKHSQPGMKSDDVQKLYLRDRLQWGPMTQAMGPEGSGTGVISDKVWFHFFIVLLSCPKYIDTRNCDPL